MARYRSIQTTFWQDNFIMSLPLIEKAFYNYLLTKAGGTGIYSECRGLWDNGRPGLTQ